MSLLDNRSLYLLDDLVWKIVHAVCTRGVLGRGLEDFLFTIASNRSLTAGNDIGAIELVSHELLLSRFCFLEMTLRGQDLLIAECWAASVR